MKGELPRAQTDFEYRGLDAVFLENAHLRILVLPGKGGDILEFRDKHTDVDVLWGADHEWQVPEEWAIPTLDPAAWHDYYPGGWQVNLPLAGYTDTGIDTAPYGLHGESALRPFEFEVQADAAGVRLRLATRLVRYPFRVERELSLPADEPALYIDETVTNDGAVELEYIWQHHLALGEPLVSSASRLDIPARTGVVEDYGADAANNRLAGGERFDWPEAPGVDGSTVDMRAFPPREELINDVAYATDLEAGWYALTNPEIDLGFAFTFPTDPFECVWCWQPLGGEMGYPYFGRNYNVGLEPTTAYPASDVPSAQQANETMDTLGPGESVTASFVASTYHGIEAVDSVGADGTVHGR